MQYEIRKKFQCEDPSQCSLAKLEKDLPIRDAEYSQRIKDLENYYDERVNYILILYKI